VNNVLRAQDRRIADPAGAEGREDPTGAVRCRAFSRQAGCRAHSWDLLGRAAGGQL